MHGVANQFGQYLLLTILVCAYEIIGMCCRHGSLTAQRVFDERGPRTKYSANLLDSIIETLQLKVAAIPASAADDHVKELHAKNDVEDNSDEYAGYNHDLTGDPLDAKGCGARP